MRKLPLIIDFPRFLSIFLAALICAFGFSGVLANDSLVQKRTSAYENLALNKEFPFVAYQESNSFVLPSIILSNKDVSKKYISGSAVSSPKWNDTSHSASIIRSSEYILEGMNRMTGKSFSISASSDLSKGIILTTLASSDDSIRNNADVILALSNSFGNEHDKRESFFIKSEKERVFIVANNPDGLMAGASALMESVGYEALGMGQNWMYAPSYRDKVLKFDIYQSGKPSYYLRSFIPTSGQSYGIGTILNPSHSTDESVSTSYWRWGIGAKILGKSMETFPGHALYKYHQNVLEYIRKNKVESGFLAKVKTGSEIDRPVASSSNVDTLWVDIDGSGKVYFSDGKHWIPEDNKFVKSCNLDLSVPFVREIILDGMKEYSRKRFQEYPNNLVVLGTEPEDGWGNKRIGAFSSNKNWYPQYLASKGLALNQPYKLNGYQNLNQPNESWDAESASDSVYGFSNWLLQELDQWVNELPALEHSTSTGKDKKSLIRCSLYSYNFHDVPPNFNLDSRIRVMVGAYAKNRGKGKWKSFATQEDVALALQILLPNNPLADYRIISLAKSWDIGYEGIRPRGSRPLLNNRDLYRLKANTSAADISNRYKQSYNTGYRAIAFETDFNFGKQGLEYYLTSKMLWDVTLTPEKLESIRNRWLKRSFGSGWKEMKSYYDFMLVDNYPQCNGPSTWLKAVKMIDAASREIEAAGEVDELKRIDDIKQYWYNLHLFDTKQHNKNSKEFKTYLWKGQMSYMVAMHALLSKYFNSRDVRAVVGNEISETPAHYTHQETRVWWNKVMSQWVNEPVSKCM
jgi:hypothetical protein